MAIRDTGVCKRHDNFSQWYQDVIRVADLAEDAPNVRGCMVIKPWGFAIWERLRDYFDAEFKRTGHVNAYFPLLIPLELMQKEAAHVAGFAKECAVVTHRSIMTDGDGKLVPGKKLTNPYIIRPTSETIIGEMYAKWVNSYRDLPILMNQWANVMRWERRTRPFLRTSEFLWQEGHTAHETPKEAFEETLKMLRVYEGVITNMMAISGVPGEKTPDERFPGAVNTYTIEAMMQDGKALQAGTSHFLGQTFAKSANIEFVGRDGARHLAWTTSWGVSTRLIGGLIMTHSDDYGLVLPPRLAPHQIRIASRITEKEGDAMKYAQALFQELDSTTAHGERIRSYVNTSDAKSSDLRWDAVRQGVPVFVEIGAREVVNETVTYWLRTVLTQKFTVSKAEFVSTISSILEGMQSDLLAKSKALREENTIRINSLKELKEHIIANQVDEEDVDEAGEKQRSKASRYFYEIFCDLDSEVANAARESFCQEHRITSRCCPLDTDEEGTCIFSGAKGRRTVLASAY